VPRW